MWRSKGGSDTHYYLLVAFGARSRASKAAKRLASQSYTLNAGSPAVITLREQSVQDCLNAVTAMRRVSGGFREPASDMLSIHSGYAYSLQTLTRKKQRAETRARGFDCLGSRSRRRTNCRSQVTYSEHPSAEPRQRAMACRSRHTCCEFSENLLSLKRSPN